ncbi:unnamed protein product [Owenia fusiformis]|uniref:Nose resistant-to-fluoxetine protein N-terminal domain-containing protein n=1 Tax=Owenia fusiformis TaxID=6347 RepID=A0A8S4N640_OWEFU|nr:unnamed protein product [Owenia fusiformis]
MSIRVNNKWFYYTEENEDRKTKDISLQANFKAQYFRVKILGLDGVNITFGVCAPDSCQSSDVHRMLNDGERSFSVISVTDPRSSRTLIKNDPGAIVALCIISMFVAIVLAASAIDMFYITPKRKEHEDKIAKYEATTDEVNLACVDSNDKHGTQASSFTMEDQSNDNDNVPLTKGHKPKAYTPAIFPN